MVSLLADIARDLRDTFADLRRDIRTAASDFAADVRAFIQARN
jgi:hypothetical protein